MTELIVFPISCYSCAEYLAHLRSDIIRLLQQNEERSLSRQGIEPFRLARLRTCEDRDAGRIVNDDLETRADRLDSMRISRCRGEEEVEEEEEEEEEENGPVRIAKLLEPFQLNACCIRHILNWVNHDGLLEAYETANQVKSPMVDGFKKRIRVISVRDPVRALPTYLGNI